MVKLECIYEFSLRRFNELFNITRKNADKKENGLLYVGDTFECSQELADYLLGNNQSKMVVAKIIEVEPEKVITNTATLNKDIPTTQGLDIVTTYKSTTKKRTKKSKK